MDITNVAVIGAGTMGNGIAHVFAQKGFTVALIDTAPEYLDRALATISKNLDRQVKKEIIAAEEKDATLGRSLRRRSCRAFHRVQKSPEMFHHSLHVRE